MNPDVIPAGDGEYIIPDDDALPVIGPFSDKAGALVWAARWFITWGDYMTCWINEGPLRIHGYAAPADWERVVRVERGEEN